MRLIEAEPRTAVQVVNAHCALELKAPGFDKGSAIAAFLSTLPFRGRKPIFVGDDATDEAGFALVAARGGYAYFLGPMRPGAVGAFWGPEAGRELLCPLRHYGGWALRAWNRPTTQVPHL